MTTAHGRLSFTRRTRHRDGAAFYHSIAGAAWADWLFMIGLMGIGLVLILGIGMRIAAVTGAVLLVLMYTVVLPPADTAAALTVADVTACLATSADGLTGAEADRRRAIVGPNAVRSHHAGAAAVLFRQFRSPLLILLAVTAGASFFLGERDSAAIIGVILLASVELGFANEFRAERAADALHAQVRHRCAVRRDGRFQPLDVTALVPRDLVELRAGEVVPVGGARGRRTAAPPCRVRQARDPAVRPRPAYRRGPGRPTGRRADPHRQGRAGIGGRALPRGDAANTRDDRG